MKTIGGTHTKLLLSLIVLLSVVPFIDQFHARGLIVESLFVLMIVSALFDVRGGRRFLIVGAIVAGPAIISSVVDLVVDGSRAVEFTSTATTLAFLLFAMYRLGTSVLGDRNISQDTIRGAICIYLLIGITWSTAYSLVDLAYPGSFNHPVISSQTPDAGPGETATIAKKTDDAAHFFYFSFVTLSTLGYGDMTPVSAPARFLAWLEAVVGQLFIAVTIARLVALQTSRSMIDREDT